MSSNPQDENVPSPEERLPEPLDTLSQEEDEEANEVSSSEDAGEPEPEDEEDILDFDKISEQEERDKAEERRQLRAFDNKFLQWIQEDDEELDDAALESEDDLEPAAFAPVRRSTFVELELSRLGISAEDELIAVDPLPERFTELDRKERRTRMVHKAMSDGREVSRNRRIVAQWIFRMLTKPGYAYFANSAIIQMLESSSTEWLDQPIVSAIEFVLTKSQEEFLEPGHLMVFYRKRLQPLLDPLLQVIDGDKDVHSMLPYLSDTGQRVMPEQVDTAGSKFYYFALSPNPGARIGGQIQDIAQEGDPYAHRKAGFIPLGRVLWEILELDALSQSLERARLVTCDQLSRLELTDTNQSLKELIVNTPFETVHASVAWAHCAEHLQQRELLRDSMIFQLRNDIAISLDQLLVALKDDEHIKNDGLARDGSLRDFLLSHVRDTATHTDPVKVENALQEISKLIVSEVIALPALAIRAYDSFMTNGEITLRPTIYSNDRTTRRVNIQELIQQDSDVFLKLQEESRSRKVDMSLDVSFAQFYKDLDLDRLFVQPSRERFSTDSGDIAAIAKRAAQELYRRTKPHVISGLKHNALRATRRLAITRLERFCAQGPYEETTLPQSYSHTTDVVDDQALQAFEARSLSRRPLGSARVCGVIKSENGLTVFSTISAEGALEGTLRWSAMNADIEKQQQNEKLRAFLRRHSPDVIAIGATDMSAQNLFGRITQFMADFQNHEYHEIPIVWGDPTTARVSAGTDTMRTELPSADHAERMAVSLARFVQNPLVAVAQLFDQQQSVLHLPLHCDSLATTNDQRFVYAWLEWEMSLWFAACGIDINATLRSYCASRVLQFVPGLGRRKAKALVMNRQVNGGYFTDRNHLYDVLHKLNSGTNSTNDHQSVGSTHREDYVTKNALPHCRILPSSRPSHAWSNEGPDSFPSAVEHDSLLIPANRYCLADRLAWTAMKHLDPAYDDFAEAWATSELLMLNPHQRAQALRRVTLEQCVMLLPSDEEIGVQDMLHLIDELLHAGVSVQRRPFRRLTGRRFFQLMTGIDYDPSERQTDTSRLLFRNSAVLRKGDLVEATFVRHNPPKDDGDGFTVGSLSLMTTHYFSAEMRAGDIPEGTVLRSQLDRYYNLVKPTLLQNRKIRKEYLDAGEAVPKDKLQRTPEDHITGLTRDSVLHGTVKQVNYQTCRVLLSYAEPPEPVAQTAHEEDVPLQAGDSTATSQAQSVKTSLLISAARSTATGFSKHPYFYAVNRERAGEILTSRAIGHWILRPYSGARSCFLLVVKVGENDRSVANFLMREDRNSNGQFAYFFVNDSDPTRRFNDIDQAATNLVDAIVPRIKSIRNHRHFSKMFEGAAERLANAPKDTLTYALFERKVQSTDQTQSFYVFLCSCESKGVIREQVKIKIDHERNLIANTSSLSNMVPEVRGANAEALIAQIKSKIFEAKRHR